MPTGVTGYDVRIRSSLDGPGDGDPTPQPWFSCRALHIQYEHDMMVLCRNVCLWACVSARPESKQSTHTWKGQGSWFTGAAAWGGECC